MDKLCQGAVPKGFLNDKDIQLFERLYKMHYIVYLLDLKVLFRQPPKGKHVDIK